jgi:hypothetical protein
MLELFTGENWLWVLGFVFALLVAAFGLTSPGFRRRRRKSSIVPRKS